MKIAIINVKRSTVNPIIKSQKNIISNRAIWKLLIINIIFSAMAPTVKTQTRSDPSTLEWQRRQARGYLIQDILDKDGINIVLSKITPTLTKSST
jgi:hypothetical protein